MKKIYLQKIIVPCYNFLYVLHPCEGDFMSFVDQLTYANIRQILFSEVPTGSLTNQFMIRVSGESSLNKSMNIVQIHPNFMLGATAHGTMNTSQDVIFSTIKRIIATAVILPTLSYISVFYNGAVGVVKLGFAVVAQMKRQQEGSVKANFNEAFQHLITAVADFAVTFFSTAIAIANGVLPHDLAIAHRKLYLGEAGKEAVAVDASSSEGAAEVDAHCADTGVKEAVTVDVSSVDNGVKEQYPIKSLIQQGADFLTEQLFRSE